MSIPDSDIADDRILALLQGGGNAELGFRLLLAKYQEKLYTQIRRLVWQHDDANDVLQNCLVKVFRSIHTFEGKSKLYTWLYRIATNEAITFLNKKKQRRTEPVEAAENAHGQHLRADGYFDGDEALRRLHEAIATLPDKQRLVFHLRYFDDLSYADMSAMLGTSEGALKASYHHAVKKIEVYVQGLRMI